MLDFGCGIGLLAIPLAKMGCKVIACDFSEGMLAMLREGAAAAGVSDSIDVRLLAWDDDWQAAGIEPDSVDVAIASRSISTHNLLGALTKLDRTARERACVTVAAGARPVATSARLPQWVALARLWWITRFAPTSCSSTGLFPRFPTS